MNFNFVFYVAGVDIHKNDKLGKLNISTQGIIEREKMVIKNFYKNNVPLCDISKRPRRCLSAPVNAPFS